jgi:uncharacterized protein (DUF1810 family)
MMLFSLVSESEYVYGEVLDKYFDGKMNERTREKMVM